MPPNAAAHNPPRPLLDPDRPALVLAPMDGVTDAPLRAVLGEVGGLSYAVAEFVRVSGTPVPEHVFLRQVPEIAAEGARTPTGLPVQVQILGGHPGRVAESAVNAVRAGATGIDLNFGCPAPTVNNHDGGASLLKHPARLREIVRAVRDAVPAHVPVSAKLRLGWENPEDVLENAAMAAEGGADWLTVHARTRAQGYRPPAHWSLIRRVREGSVPATLPVVANGDIWTLDDLRRCRDETGCAHFMLGRGAIADPRLPGRAARELGLLPPEGGGDDPSPGPVADWRPYLRRLAARADLLPERRRGGTPVRQSRYLLHRQKQWLKIAHLYGGYADFDAVKRAESEAELFALLDSAAGGEAGGRGE